jgi:hypothetical protein
MVEVVRLWDEHQGDSDGGGSGAAELSPLEFEQRVKAIAVPFARKKFSPWSRERDGDNFHFFKPTHVREGILRRRSKRFGRLPICKYRYFPFDGAYRWVGVADVIVDLEQGKVHEWSWR